ncbi:hypothetical protein OUZ56_005660 [Daphnia magna]|uniref:Uncharacterized protein n=1 Tax=Daphnia magna TaxID=35525 RepID=A0ABQ9YTN5_9CRUS|nr:hypothetical protein OUZ56_005660 [Daphnia magna]
MPLAELKEAITPKYSGDIRYKPKIEEGATASSTTIGQPERDPGPSTAEAPDNDLIELSPEEEPEPLPPPNYIEYNIFKAERLTPSSDQIQKSFLFLLFVPATKIKLSRGVSATRAGLKGHLTRTMDKIKQYKNLSMTAELNNDLATETELLKQRYLKFIKASDQVRWTLQSTNATEEQIEQDYSAVAEVEEDMSAVLALDKNKREEYKRQLDAEFQDQQRKDEPNGKKIEASCYMI